MREVEAPELVSTICYFLASMNNQLTRSFPKEPELIQAGGHFTVLWAYLKVKFIPLIFCLIQLVALSRSCAIPSFPILTYNLVHLCASWVSGVEFSPWNTYKRPENNLKISRLWMRASAMADFIGKIGWIFVKFYDKITSKFSKV